MAQKVDELDFIVKVFFLFMHIKSNYLNGALKNDQKFYAYPGLGQHLGRAR